MYLGEDRRDRAAERRMTRAQSSGTPNLQTTLTQRRLERDADRIERREASELERVQRRVPTTGGEMVTPSGGSPIVTADNGDAAAPGSGTSAGGTASGGSSTVTVAPGEGGGVGILPLVLGAAALFLL